MAGIAEYILGVFAAALLCGIAAELMGKKGLSAGMVRLICGVFLTLTVAAPLGKLNLSSLPELAGSIQWDAADAAEEGKNLAQQQYREVITQRTQTYILDKAESLGLTLQVTVRLSDTELAVPESVSLQGNASPYARKTLSRWLAEELGLDTEAQEWIATN